MKTENGMKIRKLRRELDVTQDEIGKAIGGTFIRTATGKTFDAYKYTDNE